MARGNQSGKQGGRSDGEPHDWVTRAADDTVRHARQEDPDAGTEYGRVITCASGASPSGPVHLGNLREFLTVHFVAEELRRRGLKARHLHSWDDYDRFRKVPAGVDPSWSQHIGRPYSAVPDPWECHASWAEHFIAPLESSLAALGVEMVTVSQTEQYRAGAYRDQVLTAVERRADVEQVLASYRTKAAEPGDDADGDDAPGDDEAAGEPDDAASGAGDLSRFPFKPYCRDCGRDTVSLTSYDDATTDLAYTCQVDGYQGVTNLRTDAEGKLVWKVDWPMRWVYEGVDFEPGGVDHASPGSSYTVGSELVGEIYGGRAPRFVGYSFVGAGGQVKMSSSRGGVPTAADALEILEAPILRWLYVRRQPKQAFDVDFGPDVVRLYDEWDALGRKAAQAGEDPGRRDAQALAFERASATSSAGRLPTPDVVVPFRLLSSVADVTAGDADQISRIVGEVGHAHASVAQLEPRLGKATTWMRDFVPESERTSVRESPDVDRLGSLDADEQRWISLLLERLPARLDADATTALIYGVPKLARGLGVDDAPTDEVKADQKAFFRLLYRLLVGADRGPRLPTLFLALGADRIRSLLTAPA